MGFRIVIKASNGNILYDSTIDSAAVFIEPGEITSQNVSSSN